MYTNEQCNYNFLNYSKTLITNFDNFTKNFINILECICTTYIVVVIFVFEIIKMDSKHYLHRQLIELFPSTTLNLLVDIINI